MLTKDLAVCIRAVDYSETSQIVTFFTKATGKISAIAKGSKRPKSAFDGPIEILSHGKIVFSDTKKETLATLTEFEAASGAAGFVGLHKNLFALNCCLFAAELLNSLTHDYDPHAELFDGFLQFLQDANDKDNNDRIMSLLIIFQLAMLKEVGLQPILSHCANCKKSCRVGLPSGMPNGIAPPSSSTKNLSSETYFSNSANGLVCRDCEASFPDKIRLSNSAANCLSDLNHITKATKKTLTEIEKVLIHHFTEILHRQPKMAKHILGV
jgi:DNA repair protein RecO (recombination protein O)